MSSQSVIQPTHCEYEVEIKDNITTVKIPETYEDEQPTESQKELLLQFEEEFSYRYTNEDSEYVATVKLGSTTPPLIPSYRPFWNRRRDNDRSRGVKRSRGPESYSDKRHSNYSYNRPNYGYNNDYRR